MQSRSKVAVIQDIWEFPKLYKFTGKRLDFYTENLILKYL